jgi:hypothetical protein
MLELQICASNFPASAPFSRNPCESAHLQIQSGIEVRCKGNGSTIARKSREFVSWPQLGCGLYFKPAGILTTPERLHRLYGVKVDNGHCQVQSENLHRRRDLGHDRHLPRASPQRCSQQAPGFYDARRGDRRRAGGSLAVHELRLDGPRSPHSSLSPLKPRLLHGHSRVVLDSNVGSSCGQVTGLP